MCMLYNSFIECERKMCKMSRRRTQCGVAPPHDTSVIQPAGGKYVGIHDALQICIPITADQLGIQTQDSASVLLQALSTAPIPCVCTSLTSETIGGKVKRIRRTSTLSRRSAAPIPCVCTSLTSETIGGKVKLIRRTLTLSRRSAPSEQRCEYLGTLTQEN